MPRYAVDTSLCMHAPILEYWKEKEREYIAGSTKISTRFDRICSSLDASATNMGDSLVEKVKDTFQNGLGIKWGENQLKVFNAFLFSCLPLIYGNEWGKNKARVLREWNVKRECPYTVVNMARRNGKTFVTAGTVVALFICVPNIKLAIFSTCKRTSMMMMSAAVDMLKKAFDIGTHANRQDFFKVSENTESIIYEGPDKGKRVLGCFPGSVRVRFLILFLNLCVCVCAGEVKIKKESFLIWTPCRCAHYPPRCF